MTTQKVITPFGQKLLRVMERTDSSFDELPEVLKIIDKNGKLLSPAKLKKDLLHEEVTAGLTLQRIKYFFQARNFDFEKEDWILKKLKSPKDELKEEKPFPGELTDKIYCNWCKATADLLQHLRFAPKKELEKFYYWDGKGFEGTLRIALYEHKHLEERCQE